MLEHRSPRERPSADAQACCELCGDRASVWGMLAVSARRNDLCHPHFHVDYTATREGGGWLAVNPNGWDREANGYTDSPDLTYLCPACWSDVASEIERMTSSRGSRRRSRVPAERREAVEQCIAAAIRSSWEAAGA